MEAGPLLCESCKHMTARRAKWFHWLVVSRSSTSLQVPCAQTTENVLITTDNRERQNEAEGAWGKLRFQPQQHP